MGYSNFITGTKQVNVFIQAIWAYSNINKKIIFSSCAIISLETILIGFSTV